MSDELYLTRESNIDCPMTINCSNSRRTWRSTV